MSYRLIICNTLVSAQNTLIRNKTNDIRVHSGLFNPIASICWSVSDNTFVGEYNNSIFLIFFPQFCSDSTLVQCFQNRSPEVERRGSTRLQGPLAPDVHAVNDLHLLLYPWVIGFGTHLTALYSLEPVKRISVPSNTGTCSAGQTSSTLLKHNNKYNKILIYSLIIIFFHTEVLHI